MVKLKLKLRPSGNSYVFRIPKDFVDQGFINPYEEYEVSVIKDAGFAILSHTVDFMRDNLDTAVIS